MTALDLANPAHVEALRLACAYVERFPGEPVLFVQAFALSAEVCNEGVDIADLHAAREALTDPARAAELVRGLLERVGIKCKCFSIPVAGAGSDDVEGMLLRQGSDGAVVIRFDRAWRSRYVDIKDVSRLVLALLDATSAEEAIAAVGKVGR